MVKCNKSTCFKRISELNVVSLDWPLAFFGWLISTIALVVQQLFIRTLTFTLSRNHTTTYTMNQHIPHSSLAHHMQTQRVVHIITWTRTTTWLLLLLIRYRTHQQNADVNAWYLVFYILVSHTPLLSPSAVIVV